MTACDDAPLRVQVDVQVAPGLAGVPASSALASWVESALDAIDEPRDVSVSVSVVDETESRRLNRDYRGKDRPTNVLSFPMQFDVAPPPGEPLLLGDIVLCAPVVVAEAAAQAKPVDDHWAHMVVHGVLHLAGYDHIDAAGASAMEQLEKHILLRGGVADPYIARG